MPVSFNKPVFIILILLAPVIWMMINRSNLKNSRFKHKLILGGLRALLLFMLVLALSDPRIMAPSDQVNLFFCLDLSESVRDEEKTAAEEFMKKGATVDSLEKRSNLRPDIYADFVDGWIKDGATIVGGCCEVGPAHIKELARRTKSG